MDYFITKRKHRISDPSIIQVSTLEPLLEFMDNLLECPIPMVGFDKEFNGLNEINCIPLLTQIGNSEHAFAIDDVSFPSLHYLEPYKHILFIGHNIKIDIKVARKQGLDIRNVYDTMIAEQRLGLDSKRPNDLGSTHLRRIGTTMPYKSLGKEEQDNEEISVFSNMNSSSLYENRHIQYSLGDIKPLIAIKDAQEKFIAKYNMFNLIRDENKDIPLLADAELEGININETRWKENIESNKKKLIQKELEMDNILSELNLINHKSTRVSAELVQHSLFGLQERIIKVPQKSKINYSSSQQVLQLFDKCNLPRPTETTKVKDKITGSYTYEEKETAGGEALQAYCIRNPDNILRPFIDVLIDYKEIEKELSSFGEKFLHSRVLKDNGSYDIGYKNDKTGRVHTIYRQCNTTTGRLSSGNSRIGFYNSQQIPAIPKYRECFTLSQKEIDDDWWISTVDLTGAEVTIMCAFAKDKQLYKWAIEEDDLHSPLATACWREVARRRVLLNQKLEVRDTRGGKHILDPDMVITKSSKYKQLRTDYKNGGTFGMVYGAKENTVSSFFNIPKVEGGLFIEVIKSLIPDTFKMVEEAAKFAVEERYLIFNARTNSRKYFLPYQKHPLSKEQKSKIEGEARNARMQGTQADIVKEAMWKIDEEFKRREVPNKLLLQIHDELVWKHKGKENGLIIPEIMGNTGTLYLEGFTTMSASIETEHTWKK